MPFEKVGIRVTRTGGESFVPRISEQYGIRGLSLAGTYELHLPRPVDEIDILIAHLGQPPALEARGTDRQPITAVADDRPRQAELLRFLGRKLDRLIIEAPAGATLVQIAFPGHTRGGTIARKPKRSNRRRKR